MKKIQDGANPDGGANPDRGKFEKYTVDLFCLSLFNITQHVFFQKCVSFIYFWNACFLGGANMDSNFQIPFSL